MCIYIYMGIYTYIYRFIELYVCAYIEMSVYVYIHTYTYIWTSTSAEQIAEIDIHPHVYKYTCTISGTQQKKRLHNLKKRKKRECEIRTRGVGGREIKRKGVNACIKKRRTRKEKEQGTMRKRNKTRQWEDRAHDRGWLRHCDSLQSTATHYNQLQHTATHCDSLLAHIWCDHVL